MDLKSSFVGSPTENGTGRELPVLRVVIGIDPGVNGAIAVLANGKPVKVFDMPVNDRPSGGQVLNTLAIHHALADICRVHTGAYIHAVIETPSTRPHDAPTNILRIGEGFGILKALLLVHRIPITEVRPQAWKGYYGLVKVGEYKPTKGDSRNKALTLWPAFGIHFARVKDHDRAEAMLMAHWGNETECWIDRPPTKARKPRAKTKAKPSHSCSLL